MILRIVAGTELKRFVTCHLTLYFGCNVFHIFKEHVGCLSLGASLLAHPGGRHVPACGPPISPLAPLRPQRRLVRDETGREDRHCGKDRIGEVESVRCAVPYRGTGGGTDPDRWDQRVAPAATGPTVSGTREQLQIIYYIVTYTQNHTFASVTAFFSGHLTPTHPLVMLITSNRIPSYRFFRPIWHPSHPHCIT